MSTPIAVRVQIHRFDRDRANWERTMLRKVGTGLDPVWDALEWANVQHERAGSLLTAFGMRLVHEAYEDAAKHGNGCTTLVIHDPESKGDRAYDVTFKREEQNESAAA